MTTLSPQARSVWAKSFPMGANDDRLEKWLPLWQHLDDTGAVAERIWDEWLPDTDRYLIADCLPDGAADARRLYIWLASVHDIGKVSRAFAVQVGRLAHDMRVAGLAMRDHVYGREAARHELVGAYVLEEWLATRFGFVRKHSRQFSLIVGGHHGVPPEQAQFMHLRGDAPRLVGGPEWNEVHVELLDRAAERAGVTDRLASWREVKLTQPAQVALMSLVTLADWIASNDEFFPLTDLGQQPDERSDSASRRADAGWRAANLGIRWKAQQPPVDVAEHFRVRFPTVEALPRPVQCEAVKTAWRMDPHGLMVIEAPTGEGKTEAALLAGEVLAYRTGAGGVMIALPTQATANSMYRRTLEWVRNLDAGARSVHLAHGKAFLNEEYSQLRRSTLFHASIAQDEPGWSDRGPASRLQSTSVVYANETLSGRYRAGLADFVVGTIDQVLLAALRAKYVDMRHFALIGKVVILDEVHAVDVYMSVYLEMVLEWLGAYGTPVIMLSATLPPAQRRSLMAAYERGRHARITGERSTPRSASVVDPSSARDGRSDEAPVTTESGTLAYPVITATGDSQPIVRELEPSGRSARVRLAPLAEDQDQLVSILDHALVDGGCALVIHNTVRRVQQTASRLREAGFDVEIAHARYLDIDRAERDKHLASTYGPDSTLANGKRPQRRVVVASQVVEQSLDVDFDLLVTDIAPIDLIIQRIGRVHRHVRPDRPPQLAEPVAYITGFTMDDDGPVFAKGIESIYGEYLLLVTLAVLQPYLTDNLLLRAPEDVARLVSTTYAEASAKGGVVVPASWQTRLDKARKKFEDVQRDKSRAARTWRLDPVKEPGTSLLGWIGMGVGFVDDGPEGAKQVRDSGDSIEVIVVVRDEHGGLCIPHWINDKRAGNTVATDLAINSADARTLARCAMRLPYALCHPGVFDETIASLEKNWIAGWQSNPHLRGELVLILDSSLHATVGKQAVSYSVDAGLEVET